jgi:hypothetical protein
VGGATARRTISHPFGDSAVGWLVYTPDGHVFAQLMRRDRWGCANADILRPSCAEARSAMEGYLAYGGTFEIRDCQTVVHQVDVSLAPNWVATLQERLYRIEGDRLTLTTPPILAAGVSVHRLVWERAR